MEHNQQNQDAFIVRLAGNANAHAIYDTMLQGLLGFPQDGVIHHTLTNGGDMRVRIELDPQQFNHPNQNIFTMHWQPKLQRFRCAILAGLVQELQENGFEDVGPQNGPLPVGFAFAQQNQVQFVLDLIFGAIEAYGA